MAGTLQQLWPITAGPDVLLDHKKTLGTAFPAIARPYGSRSNQSGLVRFGYVTQVHGSEGLGKNGNEVSHLLHEETPKGIGQFLTLLEMFSRCENSKSTNIYNL